MMSESELKVFCENATKFYDSDLKPLGLHVERGANREEALKEHEARQREDAGKALLARG